MKPLSVFLGKKKIKKKKILDGGKLTVWTSTLKRSIASAQYINRHKVLEKFFFFQLEILNQIHLKALDELDAGVFDGWTYDEV